MVQLRKHKLQLIMELPVLKQKSFLNLLFSNDRIFFQLQVSNRMIKVLVLKLLQVLHATLSKLLRSEFGWGEVTVLLFIAQAPQSVCLLRFLETSVV